MSVPWPYGSLVAPTPHFELGIPSQDVAYFISCMDHRVWSTRPTCRQTRSIVQRHESIGTIVPGTPKSTCLLSDLVMRAHVFECRSKVLVLQYYSIFGCQLNTIPVVECYNTSDSAHPVRGTVQYRTDVLYRTVLPVLYWSTAYF
jgi:hypothetical protein